MVDGLNMSCRIRRTPYTDRVEAAGVRGYSVVNHMLLPKAFQHSVEDDYWHLRKHVQVWDVSCQRQVRIVGRDSERLVQWMTPRDISNASIGDCLYVPIVNDQGGLINDPVLLKIADDCFWLSIADSDLLLYAKGLAIGAEFEVEIDEPDIFPLAIQGPQSEEVMCDIFGDEIRKIEFFKFGMFDFQGIQQVVARSGYSRQGGFEIYLCDYNLGGALWDSIFNSGHKYDIRPGYPNLIERIEGGLFSYGNEMSQANNPLELGFDKFCTLDGSVAFVGLRALQQISKEGIKRKIHGVQFDGAPVPVCSIPWTVLSDSKPVGKITSAIWSPRLKTNVGLGMIDRGYWEMGKSLVIDVQDGILRSGRIVELPMK